MLASVGKPGPLMASVGKTLSPIPHQNVKNIRMANISGHKSRFQAFLKALPLYDWISAIFIIQGKWCLLNFSCCRATSCSLSPSCVLSNMNGAISCSRITRSVSSTHHRWKTPISHVHNMSLEHWTHSIAKSSKEIYKIWTLICYQWFAVQ